MAVDVIELLFKAITSYDNGLDKVDAAIKQIGANSGLSGQALTNLQKTVSGEFAKMSAAGLNFNQQIKVLAASGNSIGLGVGAGAKQIQQSLSQAAQAAQNLNKQLTTTRAAATGLQGAVTNPLQAIQNAATSAAAALGPVGLAILGVTTVATLGAKAMFDLVDAQGKAAQQTVNLAAQLGISAGEMKRLQVEAELIGVSFQSMQIAARQLAVAIEEPTGAGKRASQTLRDLGVATQTASGAIRQEGAVFNDTIEKLAGIEDQTKRTEEATRLFGSRSSAAILLLIGRYKELDETARSLGYGDTTQLQEALAKGEEKINAMSSAWDLFKAKLAEKIEPVVISVVQRFTKELADNGPTIGSQAAQDRVTLENQRFYDQNGGDPNALAREGYGPNVPPPILTPSLLASSFMELGLTSSQLRGRPPRDLGGLAIGNQIGNEDLGAGAATTKRSMDAFSASLDGMTIKIHENTKKIEDDRAEQARGGLGKAEADRLAAEITHLEAQNRALKSAEEAAKETDNYFKKLHEEVTKTAQYPGINKYKPEGLTQLEAQRAYGSDIARNGGETADVTARFDQGAKALIAEWIGKIEDETVKQIREATKKSQSEMDRDFAAYNRLVTKTDDEDSLRQLAYQEGVDKLNASGQRSVLSLQQKAVLGYSKLQSGGETQGTAQLEEQYQSSAISANASSQVAEQQKLIAQLQAGSDQSEEVQKKIDTLRLESLSTAQKAEEEIATLRLDTELKLAEMRKKELAEYKQEAASIFDALREPGGRGMEKWFKGQSVDLARGVFSNATAPILQNIGQSLGGATSGMPPEVQALFKGTILDSAHAKSSPQIEATDQNTKALHLLTAAMTGQSVGGDSVQYAPGSLASNAAAIGNSAGTPLAMPGGSNIYTDTDSAITLAGTPGYRSASPGGAAAPTGGLGPLGKLLTGSSSSSTSNSFLGQLLKGATSGIGNWGEIFHGDTTTTDKDGNTTTTAVSPGQQAGAAIGTAAAAGAGIYESVNQFSKGGVSGDLGGVAALTGTAALLDPDPTSKVALTIGATLLSMFSSLFGSSIEQREASIGNQAAFDTYVPPPTLNRSLSASGGYEQVNNKYGLPSATSYTSVAIEQPYKYQSPIKDPTGYNQGWETAPGQVIEPYAAAAPQPTFETSQAPTGMTFIAHISTMDAQSFLDNSGKIASAVMKEVVAGHPVGSALQRAVIGG